jgi:hypothetical protein
MCSAAGASAQTLTDQQKLVGPTKGALRELSATGALGGSVALSANGTIALVGASQDAGAIGAAWIYERTGGVWKAHQKLRAPVPRAGSDFGSSVALSANGNTAVIAGPTTVGAVWIFVRKGSTWKFEQRLATPRMGSGAEHGHAQFGVSLAVSSNGKTVLVGGPADDRNAGAAWGFTKEKRGWMFQRKLTAPAHGSDARTGPAGFGASAALSPSGTTAVIGGPGDDPLPSNDGAVGAAWIFTRSGNSWTDLGKLTAPVNGPDEEINTDISGGGFGSSVGIAGDGVALIGGAEDNNLAGAAWVYTQSGATWSEQHKLTAPPTGPDAEQGGAAGFGSTLALTPAGTTALVGGPSDGFGTGDNLPVGAAWVFTEAGQTWTDQEKLDPPTSGPDRELIPGGGIASEFGSSVALSGDALTAAIGGPADDDPFEGDPYPDYGGPGAAWIFAG